MSARATRRRGARWSTFVLAVLVVLCGAGLAVGQVAPDDAERTPSIFDPSSTPAEAIEELSWLVLAVTGTIFAVVVGILVFTIVRFRARPGDEGREPPQIYGSNPIEFAWTAVPVMIVVVLTLVTIRGLYALDRKTPPDGALAVIVIGHQWWWEFRYPELGIVTANELHVPVDRVTWLHLASADVIHSFWVPELAGKTDAVPNRINRAWIEPKREGLFVGQCAEYCGTQHANMLLRVEVQSADDFEAWAAAQAEPAREDPTVASGRDAFQSLACINCHNSEGTVATGTFGPDLTHLMSRETIGSGILVNSPENLREWVRDPQQFKVGCHMPDLKMTPAEVKSITDYLLTLD